MADIEALKKKAKQIRKEIVTMLCESGSGHPGGSLSCADILTALYFSKLKINPKNPKSPDRDRFVLSKGHAAPALYACLAEVGFFPKSELKKLRKINSMLQGHPAMKTTPGVEASTGSLGQGLSIANGIALAGKLDKKDYRVYCLIGDGESQEGQIWEAAMTAGHYKLDNLTLIVDYNNLQIDGTVDKIKDVTPLKEKFEAFRWNVLQIDGHDFNQILNAFEKAEKVKGKPTAIIANTVKGKGVSFMQCQVEWHGKAPNKEELMHALKELE